jgi:hypothetical protein
MKIKGWEKISGYTYKGYSIVNPIHNASEEVYYATILDLNHIVSSKWDITLTTNNTTGVITFRILDNLTKHLLAKSHFTKINIDTLQKFREQYEMLIDDILEGVQSYTASKVAKNINGGTTGIINQVQSAGTNVLFNSSYGSSSLSTTTPALLIKALKDLQKQIDDNNKKL